MRKGKCEITITVKEASKLMGKTPEYVRSLVASGMIPKSGVFQREGSTKKQYHINKAEFERFIGK